MKKIMWRVMCLFAVVCMVRPLVGMDRDSFERLKDTTGFLLREQGRHVDLMEAANILPTDKDDQAHLCTKDLNGAMFAFIVEQKMWKKQDALSESTKNLIKRGDRAIQGAYYLIGNFIKTVEEQKKVIKKHEDEIVLMKRIEATSRLNLKASQEKEGTLREEKNALQKSLEDSEAKVQNLQSKKQKKTEQIKKAQGQFAVMRIQRNVLGLAFLVSAIGFLTCFLRVNYASVV